MVLKRDVTERLAAFEQQHESHQYRVHHLRMWPILRIWLAFRCLQQIPHKSVSQASVESRFPKLRRFSQHGWRRLLHGFSRGAKPWHGPVKVVALTQANRVVELGQRRINAVMGPFVQRLRERGISVQVWETGRPRWRSSVSSIDWLLDWSWWTERAQHRVPQRQPRPSWFPAVATWAAEQAGFAVEWPEIDALMGTIVLWRNVMKGWLRRCGARLLAVDCWYSWQGVAAAAAAYDLGIPVMDLQHGIQGPNHFAYAQWAGPADGVYEVMPTHYWTWGEEDRRNLLASNHTISSSDSVLPGGNLWLHDWLRSAVPEMESAIADARRIVGNAERAILVTLQKEVPYQGVLTEALAASPPEWLWLIRPHRQAARAPQQIHQELSALTAAEVRVLEAMDLPLYALFHAVQNHVTGFSTCALEALPFGVPTVLVHPVGRDEYRFSIAAGVMLEAGSGGELLQRLVECDRIPRPLCRQTARAYFSPPSHVDACMEQLSTLLHNGLRPS